MLVTKISKNAKTHSNLTLKWGTICKTKSRNVLLLSLCYHKFQCKTRQNASKGSRLQPDWTPPIRNNIKQLDVPDFSLELVNLYYLLPIQVILFGRNSWFDSNRSKIKACHTQMINKWYFYDNNCLCVSYLLWYNNNQSSIQDVQKKEIQNTFMQF